MNDDNMAERNENMTECKACGKDIAKGVKKCPSCGKDQRNFFARHKILTGILVLLVLAAIGGAIGGGGDDDTDNDVPPVVEKEDEDEDEDEDEEVEDEEVEEEKDEYYFDGEVAELEKATIKITNTKIIQVGEEGNLYGDAPVFALWYEVTNKSDKEIDPTTTWISSFEALQDNSDDIVNKLSVSSLPDSEHLDTQMAKIKPGGTLENSVGYELDDETTPLTLIASKGLLGGELGRHDFEIIDK